MESFRFFQFTAKERKERVSLIAVELKALWSMKLNFFHVSDQAIRAKLEKLLLEYDHCRKKHDFESLNELFDVTKVKDKWLCKEDKNLYKRQIQSKGQVGYSTGKRACAQTIHPSKRRKTLEANVSNLATASSSVASDSSESSSNHVIPVKTVLGKTRLHHQQAQRSITQGWANFLARGLHLQADFVCGPHYSLVISKKKIITFNQCPKYPFSSRKK